MQLGQHAIIDTQLIIYDASYRFTVMAILAYEAFLQPVRLLF